MKLSEPAKEVVNLVRRYRLTYDALRQATHAARKHLGMKPPTGGRKLPKLLSEAVLKAYFKAVDTTDNLGHQLMLRVLLYTGVRVAELCAIRIQDVDLAAGRVYIEQGKGSKDRYLLLPDSFKLSLKSYILSHPEQEYLFESQQRRPYSTRRIQQIVSEYAEVAGISEKVHPHLLRHQCLTFLTANGMSDAQIQLISGHSSKKSLEVYQHLSLKDAVPSYQSAMKKMEIE